MTIMMGNIRGMPTNNQNRSKVKKINELMKDTEIVALTETGSTKKDQTWICNDQMEIVKENKAIHNKDGVLVCGKGTLIATKKYVQSQKARKNFNNEKTAVHIINIDKKQEKNIIIAAH